MTRTIIRAALAAFFILQITPAFAVPIIFKTNKSILVRTPQGVVAKPGIGELLSTVPGASSSAVANGKFPLNINKASLDIPVKKTYPAASLAVAAADAILSKTAVGAIAALALPYAIDAATDLYAKQVPGTSTEPVITYQSLTNSIATSTTNAGCQYKTQFSSNSEVTACILASCQTTYPTQNCRNARIEQRATPNGSYTHNGMATIGSNTNAAILLLKYTNTNCSSFGAGYTYDTTTGQCKSTPGCTSPSTYDTATGMCIGSAINEPANKTQLEQDIADTLGNTPAAAPIILDDLLDHDIEPDNAEEEIEQPDPSSIPGDKETDTRDYFDPASGHPMHEERTKETTHEIEKKGPQQVDVTPHTETTTIITDTITNETWTISETTIQQPTESTTQEPEDYTFIAQPPEYDPAIDTPDKTPLDPMLNGIKSQIDTWSGGVGIQASADTCSISDAWSMGGESTTIELSFCEWESQISIIGTIIFSFAVLYGGFIVLGVRE